ncbi:MAG: ABC transporter permease [Coriobacteriales bacterium]|nr:ABC transporter permease [Coriobacteriales bacterium]
MLKFALKNMAIKKIQVILVVLSIVISAGIAVLAYNVAKQVDEGITNNAGYYSAIIGPAGSNTQLAMNTMYFIDEPIGTIPYSVVTSLQQDSRVTSVIPFAMADNYNGYGVVGTDPAFLNSKDIAQGRMFDADSTMEVVVGSNIAKYNALEVGDVIYTSHSANGSDLHTQGLTVVGVLKQSHSSYDNIVFTQLKTLWEMHEHGEEHEEEGEEEHHHHGAVCAVLVNTKNPGYAMQLVNDYNGKIITDDDGDSTVLQAIEPMSVVRSVLRDADNTKYIVFVLCAVILAFGVSRICMHLMNGYVASMGVVLDMTKMYPFEFIILSAIFLISVLPTVIWTFSMSRKDSITD